MPKNEDLIRFETYTNYLLRFARHSRQLHPDCEALALACRTGTSGLRALSPGFDEAWVRRFMRNAWNTESLVAATPVDIDQLRISNAWLPVQAYYAVYCASEAAAYAIDGSTAGSHRTALRKITDSASRLGVPPWNFAYAGPKGRDGKQHRPVNFPAGIVPAHNLSRDTASDTAVIARCLKAEHQNRIKENYKRTDYKRTKRRQYEYDPGPTSLFHFLYRLRIRSNYRGIDLFIVDGEEGLTRNFTLNLQTVVRRTLCFLEGILLAKCGRTFMLSLTDEFIGANKRTSWLQERVGVYRRL